MREVERHLRFGIAVLFVAGVVGSGTELVLLEHTEDAMQWIPLVLLPLSLLSLTLFVLAPTPVSYRTFQGLMLLFLAGGVLGVYLHYRGNVEFELEMYPGRHGLELIIEALKGATPALAPGMMVELGLLGLVYTFRHPAMRPGPNGEGT